MALHRRYERTCRDCGYSWTLTRRQVKFAPDPAALRRGLRGAGLQGVAGMAQAESEMTAEVEVSDELRRCARCGSEHFNERPVPRRRPAPGQSSS